MDGLGARGHGGASAPGDREAEALVERLEPVGELELVALGSAEELDAPRALGRRGPDRLERRDLARRPAGERGVERELVEVHAAVEQEEVVAGDGAAGDPQQRDPRHPERQRRQRRAVERAPGGRREARGLRPVAPAGGVQPERLLERRGELVEVARDLERDRRRSPRAGVAGGGAGCGASPTSWRGTPRPNSARGPSPAPRRGRSASGAPRPRRRRGDSAAGGRRGRRSRRRSRPPARAAERPSTDPRRPPRARRRARPRRRRGSARRAARGGARRTAAARR